MAFKYTINALNSGLPIGICELKKTKDFFRAYKFTLQAVPPEDQLILHPTNNKFFNRIHNLFLAFVMAKRSHISDTHGISAHENGKTIATCFFSKSFIQNSITINLLSIAPKIQRTKKSIYVLHEFLKKITEYCEKNHINTINWSTSSNNNKARNLFKRTNPQIHMLEKWMLYSINLSSLRKIVEKYS